MIFAVACSSSFDEKIAANIGCYARFYLNLDQEIRSLWPEQIRHFNKELSSIVDESIWIANEAAPVRIALRITRQPAAQTTIEILQVTVVTNINRSPGVQKVSDQKICIEALHFLQRAKVRINKYSVILRDNTQRELTAELVVPF